MRGSKRERRPGVWELRAYAGRDPVTGRKRYRSRRFYGGKRAADTALAQLVAEVEAEEPVTAGTVGELLEAWLELAERDLSPTTVAEYRRLVAKRVGPRLGGVELGKLRASDLDRFYLDLERGGLSPASVRRVHALIRRGLGQGVRWGWVDRNVAAAASPPPVRTVEVEPPSLEELGRIVAEADRYDADLGVLVRVAVRTGMRRGELVGLRWPAVDLEAGRLTVSATVVEAGGVPVEKPPKTRQTRRVSLGAGLVEVLADHRRRMVERAQAGGAVLRRDAWVFSRELDGGRHLRPASVSHAFAAICRRAGVAGVRFHDLRHLHATQMIGQGVPVPTVSARLGHANTATTLNVYAHALEDADREAAELADGLG